MVVVNVVASTDVGSLQRQVDSQTPARDVEGMDTVCLETLTAFEQKPDYVSIESEKLLETPCLVRS